jgi:hypothetical protein
MKWIRRQIRLEWVVYIGDTPPMVSSIMTHHSTPSLYDVGQRELCVIEVRVILSNGWKEVVHASSMLGHSLRGAVACGLSEGVAVLGCIWCHSNSGTCLLLGYDDVVCCCRSKRVRGTAKNPNSSIRCIIEAPQ